MSRPHVARRRRAPLARSVVSDAAAANPIVPEAAVQPSLRCARAHASHPQELTARVIHACHRRASLASAAAADAAANATTNESRAAANANAAGAAANAGRCARNAARAARAAPAANAAQPRQQHTKSNKGPS